MITMQKWAAIREFKERGFGKKTIARMLGVSRNTVKPVELDDLTNWRR